MTTLTEAEMLSIYNTGMEFGRRAVEDQIFKNNGENIQFVVAQAPGYISDPFPICGFAWVNIRPGTSRFARWLVRTKRAYSDSYYGGVTIWIADYNQSYDMKYTHANAMAKYFRDFGFNAVADGRLD